MTIMDNELDKFEIVTKLLDIYGSLLTEKQQEILDSYYNYNLSISEISDLKNISRSAVSDALIKSVDKLNYYEEKMHLLRKIEEIERLKGSDFSKETVLNILESEE